ncbi:hypothetical protein LTR97_003584 [Elasticomyces elasticus]|uniref:BTB domain-containing protein n=1 Tax=Elasticomyces elasticus TaxID=574655 RepID=A0AAN7W887_9PEZI|nr:hypothetical protein LTR97_003584 [Elasticomyces elasticus]
MDALLQSLESDRTIKLIIGEPTEHAATFYISKTALEQTSEFFCGALRNQHLGDGERDTLKFPEDNLTAWKVLLFWMMKHGLPRDANLVTMVDTEGKCHPLDHVISVRCWALGDKYGIPTFQDFVMLELLDHLECYGSNLVTVREAFQSTTPGSPLRELMAEEVVLCLGSGSMEFEELDALDGVIGFTSIFGAKMSNGNEYGYMPRVPPRVPRNHEPGKSPFWKFLVRPDDVSRHWVRERLLKMEESQRNTWRHPSEQAAGKSDHDGKEA